MLKAGVMEPVADAAEPKEERPLTLDELKHVNLYMPVLAVPVEKAAEVIGVSRWTIRRLVAKGELHKTSYGVIPIESIKEHLQREMEKAKNNE